VPRSGRKASRWNWTRREFDSFPAFAAAVRDALGTTWQRESFDFLVNNAGVAASTPLGETTVEAFDLLVTLHFKGVVFLTQTALRDRRRGRIVNLSTGLTGFVGPGGRLRVGKERGWRRTKYLAKELGPRGISVTRWHRARPRRTSAVRRSATRAVPRGHRGPDRAGGSPGRRTSARCWPRAGAGYGLGHRAAD